MQKKEDKVSIKTTNKEEKEGKKRAREKYRNRFEKKLQILAFAHAWTTKKLFNYVRLVGKYAFFLILQNSSLAILMLISRKPVQRRGIGEK